jgi:uncharacterized DUF497 family protein
MIEVVWDDEEGSNADHIAEHDLTKDEIISVLRNPRSKRAKSRSTGRPIVFGYTSTGRYIAVVFEEYGGDPRVVWPITAYETEP